MAKTVITITGSSTFNSKFLTRSYFAMMIKHVEDFVASKGLKWENIILKSNGCSFCDHVAIVLAKELGVSSKILIPCYFADGKFSETPHWQPQSPIDNKEKKLISERLNETHARFQRYTNIHSLTDINSLLFSTYHDLSEEKDLKSYDTQALIIKKTSNRIKALAQCDILILFVYADEEIRSEKLKSLIKMVDTDKIHYINIETLKN